MGTDNLPASFFSFSFPAPFPKSPESVWITLINNINNLEMWLLLLLLCAFLSLLISFSKLPWCGACCAVFRGVLDLCELLHRPPRYTPLLTSESDAEWQPNTPGLHRLELFSSIRSRLALTFIFVFHTDVNSKYIRSKSYRADNGIEMLWWEKSDELMLVWYVNPAGACMCAECAQTNARNMSPGHKSPPTQPDLHGASQWSV